MSVEEIKGSLAALTASEREEVTNFLFQLRLTTDPDYLQKVNANLLDADPGHWMTLEEFEQRSAG